MAFYTHNGGEVTKHQAGSNLSEENDTPLAVMRLSCGRRFSYRVYGPPDGLPVLALHGTPGSNLKFRPASTVAATLGLRLIALDRWHYGLTDAPSTPSLAGFATDVGEIADQLELARFAVIGISGGGPYAAAVAAQLGRRVTACALVAPVGPIAGVEPRPRLGLYHHVAFRILPRLPGVLPAAFGLLAGVSRRAPQLATRIAAGRAAPADRAIARDRDFALSLGQTFAAGLSRSARGPVIDMQAVQPAMANRSRRHLGANGRLDRRSGSQCADCRRRSVGPRAWPIESCPTARARPFLDRAAFSRGARLDCRSTPVSLRRPQSRWRAPIEGRHPITEHRLE